MHPLMVRLRIFHRLNEPVLVTRNSFIDRYERIEKIELNGR